ncbi:DUF1304 family protein [Tessaracoccus sp. SD287]|uniref:DUF1304 family protein n=1 Tax=Tessaracoccus sp. SD287 TaxID=2782008 RepID=UPI001A967B30|nr:DUF1304 family protein [Tessaracoccus sp. SD287]MBO1031138.1 DUF1304 family protein [Tessaracoccus sp. SD287]
MNTVSIVAILVDAAILIAVAPVEMFLVDRPWAHRFLHVEPRHPDELRLWPFCIGARNLISAVGALVGVGMVFFGDEASGRVVVLTVAWYMLLASLAMGVADLLGQWRPRGGSVMGTIMSSLLPLVVIVADAL